MNKLKQGTFSLSILAVTVSLALTGCLQSEKQDAKVLINKKSLS